MIVILLIAVLVFFLLLWLTKKNVEYYVIHLKEETSRFENIKQMEELIGEKITIFDAHGPELHPNFNLPGETGCYKSHKKLLESVKNNPGYTVILEDDVIFSEDFHSQVLKIIKKNIDFDILYLGNLDGNHGKHISDTVYKVDSSRLLTGMHAYLVKNKNVHKITESLRYSGAIDLEIPELIKSGKINGFVLWPSIAHQNHKFLSGIR